VHGNNRRGKASSCAYTQTGRGNLTGREIGKQRGAGGTGDVSAGHEKWSKHNLNKNKKRWPEDRLRSPAVGSADRCRPMH